MDVLSQLGVGFAAAATLQNLAYCFAGVFLGTLIGVLPGIGALAAVSMLLPLSFHLEPMAGLIMLAGVYYGSEYGGSTSSILLNIPGTPANAVTCLDGYPMAKQGRAGVALFVTTIASFVGGAVGIIALLMVSPLIVQVALSFGAEEYFAVMLLGLVAAATVADRAPVKGLIMIVVGLLLGTIGSDISSGVPRYTFGNYELHSGLSFIVLAMGLFGVSEVIASIRSSRSRDTRNLDVTLASMLPTSRDWRGSMFPMFRGSAVGSIIGALPGAGASIAAFMSYSVEKRIATQPERFGNGAIEGIAAPESANNAAAQTSFIPTLSLGIPGSATMALILGALMMHGIAPGPSLMDREPQLFWGLIASFWIGNVMLLVLNIPLIGIWTRPLKIPYHLLYPGVIALICIGVFSINGSVLDLMVVAVAGVAGYVLRRHGYEPAPLLIGFILGPLMEENFRRALVISGGDLTTFIARPFSLVILGATVVLLVLAFLPSLRVRRNA